MHSPITKIILLILFAYISLPSFSEPCRTKLNLIAAKHCNTLVCVRNNIDVIDANMVSLIGLRLTYVARAAELKRGKQAVHDQTRENKIIAKVTQLALEAGYPGSIAAAIYKTLLMQTNVYEKNNR